MSHPQQELHFRQNQSNFAILIRSTEHMHQYCPSLSSFTDPALLPCPAPKSQRRRQQTQTATCKQKWRPAETHVRTRAPSIPSTNQWL